MFVRVAQLFFISMLVLPTTLQLPRGFLLAILASAAVLRAAVAWRLNINILILWVLTICVGLGGVFLGAINGAPGALSVSTIYLIWPSVYLLFIGLVHSLSVMRRLESALVLGICLATTMSAVVLMAGLMGLEELVLPYLSFLDAGFGNYGGYLKFRIYNLTTVMYGFPFIAALLVVRRHDLHAWQVVGLSVLLFTMLMVAVGSGRRMFWLSIMLTPFVVLPLLQLTTLRLKTGSLVGLGFLTAVVTSFFLVFLLPILGVNPSTLAEEFLSAFQGREVSSGARFEQASALWTAFATSPLVGNGLGAAVEVVRSEDQPWAYELWFLALLMNVGILGILVYAAAIVWVLVTGAKMSRMDREFATQFIPLASALIIFLLMTATNPYLAKFDYLWVIFMPVALINARLTRQDPRA